MVMPELLPGISPPPTGGFTDGGVTTGGVTTGGVTTGGFTTGGATTGGFTTGGATTGGFTVPVEPPPTPTEVDPTVTGAVIGMISCVPESIPPLPEVVLPPAVPAGAMPPQVPLLVAEESPSAPTDVEPRLTGAVIGATTCAPDAMPSEPLVEAPEVLPAGAVPAAGAEEPDVAAESPATPTAVAPMLTGTAIGATT